MTRLISDEPAGNDALGGAHERLANAIAEVLHTEDGGRAIGLEGDWGAGKSTVVRLVEKRIAEIDSEHPTTIVVFDVWAHQGDPLRRTFLEQLIRHLDETAKWLSNPTRWKERREELARRRRQTEEQVFPRLTGRGALLALALLMVPTGVAFLTVGGRLVPFGVLLATAPLFVTLLIALNIQFRRSQSATSRGTQWSSRISSAKAIFRSPWRSLRNGFSTFSAALRGIGREFPTALLTAQAVTDRTSLTIETAEPTSVEFAETFKDLLDEALKDGRRIVLAVDNLDRVNPEDGLAIWSTLQTFLQPSSSNRAEWFPRLWILVPFAPAGLDRLWASADSESGTNRSLATSFMEKTFQLRFVIPPPVLSDWSGFLRAQLALAFPSHKEEDWHGVYRAFALHEHRELAQPTPRRLKLFVNDIGALHRQWGDRFALHDYACAALLRGADLGTVVRGDPEHLADSRFAQDVIGDRWKDVLAALHFNTSIEVARQILLREPIEGALSRGDAESIQRLISEHPEGFWAVFEDAVPGGAGTWERAGPTDLARCGRALEALVDDDSWTNRREAATFRNELRSAIRSTTAWDPFDSDMAAGLLALRHVFADDDSIESELLAAVSSTAIDADDGDSSISPGTWMEAARALLSGLPAEPAQRELSVPLTADQWVEVAGTVALDNSASMWLECMVLPEADGIARAFSGLVAPDQVSDRVVRGIEATLHTRSRGALRRTAKSIVEQLRTAEVLNGAQLTGLLQALTACRRYGLGDEEQVQQLSTEGFLLHHLHQAAAEQHVEATARLVFMFVQAMPAATKPSTTNGNSEAGHEVLRGLLDKPDTLSGFEDRFREMAADADGARSFVKALDSEKWLAFRTFRWLIENSDPILADPNFVIEHWVSLWNSINETQTADMSASVDEDFSAVIQRASPADIANTLKDSAFEPDDATLYVAVLRATGDLDLADWMRRGLSEIPQERWETSFKDPSDDLVALTLETAEREEVLDLGTSYLDGFNAYVADAVAWDHPKGAHEQIQQLVSLFPDHHRASFVDHLLRTLGDSRGRAKKTYFDLFGEVIADRNLLLRSPHLIDHICEPMLQERNVAGLHWMAQALDTWPDLIDQHEDDASTRRLRERLADALDQATEDEASQIIERIATALGVERPKQPEDTGDSRDEPAVDDTEAEET